MRRARSRWISRAVGTAGSIAFVGASTWIAGPTASAQPSPALPATLRLVFQSAWNSARHPLQIDIAATNDGTVPLGSLVVTLAIQAPARSRSAYELSLHSEATPNLLGAAFVEKGSLQPGQTRTFRISEPLDDPALQVDNALYPLKFELLSADVPVGTLRTPMIFLIEHPKVPLNFTWSWVLSESLQYRPNGVFRDGTMEADVAPGGRLATTLEALSAAGPTPTDLAISPTLVEQLRRMVTGYRIEQAGGVRAVPRGTGGAADAERFLASLRALVARPDVELGAMPFVDASLPALLAGGLGGAPKSLLTRGGEILRSELGVHPSTTTIRPPGSHLDVSSASTLSMLGYRTVLIDPGFLPIAPGLRFSPPPVVRLRGTSLSAIAPDVGVATVAASYPTDPVLGAHAALGELASMWLEFPGTPGRGAAMIFPEQPAESGAFLRAFSELVPASPWLRPETASGLVASITASERQTIPGRSYGHLRPSYLGRLADARAALAQFGATALRAGPLIARLQDALLVAEGGEFVRDPTAGGAFIDSVQRTIAREYRAIRVTNPVAFTLASQRGIIPVTVRNHTGFRVRVRLRLVADRRLSFPMGNPRIVTLPAGIGNFSFLVRAETTGRIPIRIEVQTPVRGAAQTIAETETVVRSTAYNRVALLVTIGAAVFLLAWWGRRLLPRRRS